MYLINLHHHHHYYYYYYYYHYNWDRKTILYLLVNYK